MMMILLPHSQSVVVVRTEAFVRPILVPGSQLRFLR